MRILKLFLITFILLITSCRNEVEKPADLIPREEMKEILKDLYLYRNLRNDELFKEKKIKYSDIGPLVLKKHQISTETFNASYKYYVVNDASYDMMLKEIKSDLEKSSYASKKDSIQKSK